MAISPVDAMLKALGQDPSASRFAIVLSDTFARMEIAEAEIRFGMQEFPAKRVEIWAAFPIMRRPDWFPETIPTVLYRRHCREIVEKIAHGEDVGTPTFVDMITLLCAASEKGPVRAGDVAIGLQDEQMASMIEYDGSWLGDSLATAERKEELSRMFSEDANMGIARRKMYAESISGRKFTLHNTARGDQDA